MMRGLLLLMSALPLAAHMVSVSTGEIRIDGESGVYGLRMPLYEVAHIKDPESALFESIRFSAAGAEAKLTERSCREDRADGAYLCKGVYRFSAPVKTLAVECRFHSVTVPNHVHLLRAVSGEKADQAVLDFTFPRAELRFQPPGPFETAVKQVGAGILRAVGGAAQILFLISLVLAARRRRELYLLAGMFLLAEVLACVALPLAGWKPAARFIEAAAALTIAYLAVEILVLPEAGKRWLVVAVLGVFHGFYFEIFISNAGYNAAYVMSGVLLAEVILIGLFALALSKIAKIAPAQRLVRVSASLLLVTGLAWFALRMRG